jgi:hypothetical protein
MNNCTKKYSLILCELYHPFLHGDENNSIMQGHYLVYDRFDPITKMSLSCLNNDINDETDDDNSDSNSDTNSSDSNSSDTNSDTNSDNSVETVVNKYEDYIISLKFSIDLLNLNYTEHFMKLFSKTNGITLFSKATIIKNHYHIINDLNCFKPEIAECILLPTGEVVAILKTFWIRIIQKRWKNVLTSTFKKSGAKTSCSTSSTSLKLKGMLYNLNKLTKIK